MINSWHLWDKCLVNLSCNEQRLGGFLVVVPESLLCDTSQFSVGWGFLSTMLVPYGQGRHPPSLRGEEEL